MSIRQAIGASRVRLFASLVFGWLPAMRFNRPVILSSLETTRAAVGGYGGRVHRVAAVLQVAIAVPLADGLPLDLRTRSTWVSLRVDANTAQEYQVG